MIYLLTSLFKLLTSVTSVSVGYSARFKAGPKSKKYVEGAKMSTEKLATQAIKLHDKGACL